MMSFLCSFLTVPRKTGPFPNRKIRSKGKDAEKEVYRRTNLDGRAGDRERCAGTEVSRKLGVTENTLYNWKKKYAGMGTTEIRRLRLLEEENAKLKRLVAELSLDKVMLQDILSKKD
jgi:putative transposase